MALMLESGLRADRCAAERLVANSTLRRRSLAGWQQHVEALRMYGHAHAGMWGLVFYRELRSALIPRLEFVAAHACATFAGLLSGTCRNLRRSLVVTRRFIHQCTLADGTGAQAGEFKAWQSTKCSFVYSRAVCCRPHWRGSVNKLLTSRESKVAELVGASVPFEHFKKVGGVPATKAAIKRLNARLAARGAPASCAAAAATLRMM